jgi:hypothetical protein
MNKPAPELMYEVVSGLVGLKNEARTVKPRIRNNGFVPARLNQESRPPNSSDWLMFDAKLVIEQQLSDHFVEVDEESFVASLNFPAL